VRTFPLLTRGKTRKRRWKEKGTSRTGRKTEKALKEFPFEWGRCGPGKKKEGKEKREGEIEVGWWTFSRRAANPIWKENKKIERPSEALIGKQCSFVSQEKGQHPKVSILSIGCKKGDNELGRRD